MRKAFEVIEAVQGVGWEDANVQICKVLPQETENKLFSSIYDEK